MTARDHVERARIGNEQIEHVDVVDAASPSESAAAVALNCFETWLDHPADFIAAVECMYRAWRIASCNHSRISTAAPEGPVAASSPYRPITPVGQTAYFPINVALLKRMASSQRLALKVRAGDLTMVDFIPMQETRAALEQFINDRGLAND